MTDAVLPRNSTGRVLFASLIGTTIEFFDFYIYATAAVLVFPHLFFPQGDPATATLQSFATFALAFIARPVGSAASLARTQVCSCGISGDGPSGSEAGQGLGNVSGPLSLPCGSRRWAYGGPGTDTG